MTLLEIVQGILSDMDGDEVNSISDTEESEQVARHVISTFNNLVANRDWLHTKQLITISGFGDNNFPTHMSLADNIKRLDFISYDKAKVGVSRKDYQEVKWKEPDDFLRYLNMRDSSATTVQEVTDASGTILLITNDKAPSYYTTFNEEDIVMDSFDNAVDSTLHTSKVQAFGFVIPTLSLVDNAVVDLPQEALPLLIEQATTRAQFKTRQMEDVISASESRRQSTHMARNQWKINGGIKYPNYGRNK